MSVDAQILRGILRDLKKRQGASLDDLTHTLPQQYRSVDFDPRYLVFDSLRPLIQWGLVEAYDGNQVLSATDLDSADRYSWPKDLTFYISKQALEIEGTFDVRLDSARSPVFDTSALHHKSSWPAVFVLMPFAPELRGVYDNHIATVAKDLRLEIARADDFFTTGNIMGDVWAAINQASLIIADCTDRNPNVFYEIGIAHALGKETILVTQSAGDIPFDLRHLRVIEYRCDTQGMKQFEETLKTTIRTLCDQ